MPEPSLQNLQSALTREAENAAGAQKEFLKGLLQAIVSLDQFIQERTEKNRQLFINNLSLALEQPKVDSKIANDQKLGPLVKQILTASKDALTNTHNKLADSYDKQVLHKASHDVQTLEKGYENRSLRGRGN
jgi:hypothetical protein